MIKYLTSTLLLFITSQSLLAHGGHAAAFRYQIEEEFILLEFRIERTVLEHFDMQDQCEDYETATAWCLSQYINANNTLVINGAAVNFELEGARVDKDFFILSMSAEGDFSTYESISISNDCFLEFDRRFENRVIIQKSAATRSFLLNRRNTDISIAVGA